MFEIGDTVKAINTGYKGRIGKVIRLEGLGGNAYDAVYVDFNDEKITPWFFPEELVLLDLSKKMKEALNRDPKDLKIAQLEAEVNRLKGILKQVHSLTLV